MFASLFGQPTGAASGAGSIVTLIVPWVLILGIFYLLLWRPQQKAQRDHRARIQAAKKGDTVVTGGGLIGKVVRVDEDEVELELGPNVRVRAVKSTLTDVRLPGGKPAND
ncbi:preprotein translocase subunit YajC [Sphingomonas nostoxanthinifaciens]|uniref:preprotein translocase subunit YajC n=1 Tax=Sphingomonas nostoxanthinifaciens TaxID=2872652 RepID=UPI001CC1F90C|nr:preprotein translocase subunit YajC [Sphingomonas nostoxanthinifaciens]UAK24599.1 preprotein translocase subunit YajC [Sphingomonas nostoxanthinifaciens]